MTRHHSHHRVSFSLSSCSTAPFGSFIRVEFRDQFSLEESDTCEYDKLEVRDGQFGYSDLIGTLCGHTFPQEISSTDRHLWLRFKSDESIEYSGFRAVYHFIPLPTTRPEPPSKWWFLFSLSLFFLASCPHLLREKYTHKISQCNGKKLFCLPLFFTVFTVFTFTFLYQTLHLSHFSFIVLS